MARIARIQLQSEAAECGLACLAMVAGHLGAHFELRDLRRRFPISLKGSTLAQLMRHAGQLNLACRALRAELDDLVRLRAPCILHWNLDHFVVLERASPGRATIIDPASGRSSLPMSSVSRSFTGVVLELAPGAGFEPVRARRRLRLSQITGRLIGLRQALVHVLVLAVGLEAIALVNPVITQVVVDGALVSGDRDLLLLAVLGGGALLFIDFGLRMARGWVALRINQQLATQWAGNLFAHLLRLPLGFFEKRHLGDITSRFGSLTSIRAALTHGVVTGVLDGAMALATVALMVAYSARLTLVAAVALVLYGAIRAIAYRPFRAASEERIVFAARENSYFLESVRAVLPLKLYGRTAERVSRWNNLMVDVQNRDVATERMKLWFGSASTLIHGCEGMLLLYLGGHAVLDRSMSLGMLLAFLAYRGQFSARAGKLIDLWIELRMLGLHAERLADIALEAPEGDAIDDTDLGEVAPRIEFRDVSFRYAEGEPWVLRHVDLVIEAGDSVAVVGSSGCGKSTLMNLLLGLYPATEGEIRVGAQGRAVRLAQVGIAAWQRRIGAVMQDDALLSGSLADNIACFDPHADPQAVEAAARQAAVHDDIVGMPMGYRTLVGDMGTSLSGGQKQRVLLARALYRQPAILALDEATSHLDLDNERKVNGAIKALELTRIVIAHRPETIASASRVVVLERGAVVRDLRVDATVRAVADPAVEAPRD